MAGILATKRMRGLVTLPLLAVLLSGCADGISPFKRAAATTPESETSASPESVKIVDRDVEQNLLLVKGSIPGPRNGVVVVREDA